MRIIAYSYGERMKNNARRTIQIYAHSFRSSYYIYGIGENTLRKLSRTDKTFPVIKVETYNKINSGLLKDWIDKATHEGKNI